MKSQAPLSIPGYEEKCSDVVGCCGFATGMQQTYSKSLILRASTVSQTLISVLQEIIKLNILLHDVTMPESVAKVGAHAFEKCIKLKEITFSLSNYTQWEFKLRLS